MELKRIDPMSCAKILGIIYAALGLIFGAMFSLISMLGAVGAAMGTGEGGALFGALFGVGAIIILPIFYGVIGFIGGALVAAIYNVASKWVGGLRLELQ